MNTIDPALAQLLDDAYPAPRGAPGNWGAVLSAAESAEAAFRTRRRVLIGALPLAVAVAVFAALHPFDGGSGGVLKRALADRALAAVGEGPALHVIVRIEPPGMVIDLATGRLEKPYAVLEEWYEPRIGLREKVLRSNSGYVPGSISAAPSIQGSYVAVLRDFATTYKAALRSDRAQTAGTGVLFGRRVRWIRFQRGSAARSRRQIAVGDSYEVAVNEKTYRPLFVRLRSHGRVIGDGVRVLSIDTRRSPPLSTTAVPSSDDSNPPSAGFDLLGALSVAQASSFMTRPGLWLGSDHAGLPLAGIIGVRYSYGPGQPWADPEHRWPGLRLVYGSVDRYLSPIEGKPYVILDEFGDEAAAKMYAGSAQPEGTLVRYGDLEGGTVHLGGVYIRIGASSPELVVSAARSLEPIPADGS